MSLDGELLAVKQANGVPDAGTTEVEAQNLRWLRVLYCFEKPKSLIFDAKFEIEERTLRKLNASI